MSTAHEVGIKEGRAAAEAGRPNSPDRMAFFNDAGAAMEYRDAFRKGWHDRYNEKLLANLPRKGSVVSALIGGRQQDVRITEILTSMTPHRFEADRVILDKDQDDWHYPEQADHVWGYLSDIISIIKR